MTKSRLFFRPYPPFYNQPPPPPTMPSPSSDNTSYSEKLTQDVLQAPIHQTLGLKLTSQSSTPTPTAFCNFTTTSIHLTPLNTVHGGISSLLIDSACHLALIPTLSDGQSSATLASSFQILSSVPGEGKLYEVVGKVKRKGKSIAFCEGEVSYEGRVIASGTLTKMIVKAKGNDSKLWGRAPKWQRCVQDAWEM